MTVVMPFSLRSFSRSVSLNLSTPDDTIGSSADGATSAAMSAALPPPPTVKTTGMPAVRAAASKAFTLGMEAMQRGLRCGLQLCWLKSSIKSAVVFLSIVTVFKAGGGGAFTEDHSSMIVCETDDRTRTQPATPAIATITRNDETDFVVSMVFS